MYSNEILCDVSNLMNFEVECGFKVYFFFFIFVKVMKVINYVSVFCKLFKIYRFYIVIFDEFVVE